MVTLFANGSAGNSAIFSVGSTGFRPNADQLTLNPTWMSETEFGDGKIPAVLHSDEDLGITSPTTTFIDMDETETEVAASASLNIKPGLPLAGSVTHTAGTEKAIMLRKGSVVFAPSHDTVVTTPFGSVKMDARSLVFISCFQRGLTVYGLHDTHSKAVILQAAVVESC